MPRKLRSALNTFLWRYGMRLLLVAVAITILVTLPTSTLTVAALPAANVASDGPGALSYFDLARKDCIGTARNTTSKVWFTVAGGVLSDTYFPTIDNTNVKTLQFVVTDGSTFTDLQTRDTTYSVQLPDARSLECQVTTTAKSGKYRIVTDYLTDADHNTVVMDVHFVPLVGDLSTYQLYALYDPTINGNGGGGAGNGGGDTGTVDTSTGNNIPVAFDTTTASNAANRTYAVPVYSALDASSPFLQVSNGFLGAPSDGLVQLDAAHELTAIDSQANNGNVVHTAQVDLTHGGRFELALGFGTTQAEAVNAAEKTLDAKGNDLAARYNAGWHEYDDQLIAPPDHLQGVPGNQWHQLVDEYFLNANMVKASEDKTFPGALVASVASPWGQAVSAGDPHNIFFGSYREVFARDVYEAWTGLLLDGDLQTARAVVTFLFDRQQRPDGSFPRNSLLNGRLAPDSSGTQLDEASYPIIMAYQLGMKDADLYQNHIKPAANFVIGHGPAFGVERWEEQNGYSPSTIAAEIAGLVAAADIAQANGDIPSAQVWLGVADDWQRSIESWTVTTNGPLAAHPYFIRLSKTGDPNAAISYNVGNGGPTLDQRTAIDAGFLELVRLGLKPFSDTAVTESLPIVDATIKMNTPSGPGWHRYNGDGYGDGATDGHPWAPTGQGTGHVWPLLTEERGEYALASGDTSSAITLLSTMRNFGSDIGLIPEQDWELPNLAASPFGTDPTVASIGFVNGKPAGSADPLTWAAGVYVRLLRDIVSNKLLEQPAAPFDRYVAHQQEQTSLTVTAPPDQSTVNGSPVTVTGTSAPGNTIYVAATNTDNNSQTSTISTTTNPNGTFSVTVPITDGTTILNVVAVSPTGATAHVERSIVFDFTPGTVLLDVTDPSGDDDGPGNYAYPTAGDFHAGAFDILEFRVILSPDTSTVTFKLKTRDLTPTFGSPLGAQLVDVYVHNPNAASADTSTAASFPQRNYVIASTAAWSRLLEVQGFGQRYIDAHGTTLGAINISANAISRFMTFSIPTTSLGGAPDSGWGFTVVLTGQDGFSPDQARAFTATPGPYTFGVCATASNDPHCTVNPNTVPKAMDVITPSGVNQSNELDYTLYNPVTLQAATVVTPTQVASPTGEAVTPTPPASFSQTTMLYSQNFESGAPSDWDLQSGWQVVKTDGGNALAGKGNAWARVNNGPWGDYLLRFRAKVGNGSLRAIFRLVGQTSSRYFVGIDRNTLSLSKESDGTFFHNLARAPGWGDEWHTIEVAGIGPLIVVSVDSQQMMTYTDSAPILNGGIAFESMSDSTVLIDEVEVWGVAVPSPAAPSSTRTPSPLPSPVPTLTIAPTPAPLPTRTLSSIVSPAVPATIIPTLTPTPTEAKGGGGICGSIAMLPLTFAGLVWFWYYRR